MIVLGAGLLVGLAFSPEWKPERWYWRAIVALALMAGTATLVAVMLARHISIHQATLFATGIAFSYFVFRTRLDI